MPPPWTPPDPYAPTSSTPSGPAASGPGAPGTQQGRTGQGGPVAYTDGPPLGGSVPVPAAPVPRSDRKELFLTAALLLSAIVAGASTVMPWRDYGQRFGSTAVETGWDGIGDSVGRGWLVMLIAIAIAVSGVLIAAGRARLGRTIAALSGTALVLVSILEWGLGAGDARSGPGMGLWVDLAVGVFVIVIVGALGPADD